MIEKLKSFFSSKKGGRVLVAVGIAGILLIYLSSFFSEKGEDKTVEKINGFSVDEYAEGLEQQVREIVAAVSGDTTAVVTVTLESGPTFVYAEDKKQENKSEESEKSEALESSYIIVRGENGEEKALIVTEKLPTVRGVAIVCGPVGEDTRDKIKNAVMAALDITSRRIFIANRTQ